MVIHWVTTSNLKNYSQSELGGSTICFDVNIRPLCWFVFQIGLPVWQPGRVLTAPVLGISRLHRCQSHEYEMLCSVVLICISPLLIYYLVGRQFCLPLECVWCSTKCKVGFKLSSILRPLKIWWTFWTYLLEKLYICITWIWHIISASSSPF